MSEARAPRSRALAAFAVACGCLPPEPEWPELPTTAFDTAASTEHLTPEGAWWDAAWPCRIPFSIEPMGFDGEVQNAVVLARLETAVFGPRLTSEATDLRVIASDHATPLSIEFDDELPGDVLTFWIGVERLQVGTSLDGWIYYGHSSPEPGDTALEWTHYDYGAVHHLGSSLAGLTLPEVGSANQELPITDGMVAGGRRFEGASDRPIRLQKTDHIDESDRWSMSFWTRVRIGYPDDARRGLVGTTTWGLEVYDPRRPHFTTGSVLDFRLRACAQDLDICSSMSGGAEHDLLDSSSARVGEWHHVGLVYVDGAATLYVDGIPTSDIPLAAEFSSSPADIVIGMNPGSSRPAYSDFDEFRLYDGAWPPERIAADYATVMHDFVHLGTPECFR